MKINADSHPAITVSKNDLLKAAEDQIISLEQSNRLWACLKAGAISSKSNQMLRFFYYFGALLAISAMTWFMTLGWNRFTGVGLFVIAFAYGVCFFVCGYLLWQMKDYKIPGGLLGAMAVCMSPLAIYGLEKHFNLWPMGDPGNYAHYYFWIKGSWVFMEIGTIITALVVMRWIRFPFIVAPIAWSLWCMSMDLTPLLFHAKDLSLQQDCWVSIVFGVGMVLCSYLIDKRTREDYAFWGYLFGLMSFSGGLFLLAFAFEFEWLIYCFVNLMLMVMSILIGRKVLMVFGALGVFSYLWHLADTIFAHSWGFPFVLSLIGLTVIGLGIIYQKNVIAIRNAILKLMPKKLQKILIARQE